MTQVRKPTIEGGNKLVETEESIKVILFKVGGNRLGVSLPNLHPATTKYTEMPKIGEERAVIIKNIAVGIKRVSYHSLNIRTWKVIQ